MKKFGLTFGVLLALQGPLYSLLPPLYQGIAELKAILDDKKLGQELGSGEVILDIRKTDHGYLIVTNQNELMVQVIYQPNRFPGPAHFELEFKNPTSVK